MDERTMDRPPPWTRFRVNIRVRVTMQEESKGLLGRNNPGTNIPRGRKFRGRKIRAGKVRGQRVLEPLVTRSGLLKH